MRSVLLLLLTLAAADVMAARVEGLVTLGGPLGSCTVTLTSRGLETRTWTAVTDEDGRYHFDYVEEGDYTIAFEQDGIETADRKLPVDGDLVEVPDQDMHFMNEDTLLQPGADCTDARPVNRYDVPLCSDYELHTSLIESFGRGDGSAEGLLRSRYETADTDAERHRIAGALLRKVADDRDIWREVARESEIAVRFPRDGEDLTVAFARWCAARNLDPQHYWWTGIEALQVASDDPRSHALLLRALATEDDLLVDTAIRGLAAQHDLASLPLIEKAIGRFDHNETLVLGLAGFLDARADALAIRLLGGDEGEIGSYKERREAFETRP
jgi:hypothetical protein